MPRCGYLRCGGRAWIDSGREPAKPWFDEFSASAGPYLLGGGGGVARLRSSLAKASVTAGLGGASSGPAAARAWPAKASVAACKRPGVGLGRADDVVAGLRRLGRRHAVRLRRADILGDRRDLRELREGERSCAPSSPTSAAIGDWGSMVVSESALPTQPDVSMQAPAHARSRAAIPAWRAFAKRRTGAFISAPVLCDDR